MKQKDPCCMLTCPRQEYFTKPAIFQLKKSKNCLFFNLFQKKIDLS